MNEAPETLPAGHRAQGPTPVPYINGVLEKSRQQACRRSAALIFSFIRITLNRHKRHERLKDAPETLDFATRKTAALVVGCSGCCAAPYSSPEPNLPNCCDEWKMVSTSTSLSSIKSHSCCKKSSAMLLMLETTIMRCESRVEGKQEHGSSESSERMHEQALVGAHFRGALDAGLLVDPVEERLDRLPHTAYGLRE